MIVYHVCGASKLRRSLSQGYLTPPVRAWKTITEAERFSKQTGRQIILRLKFPDDCKPLPGHKNMAVFIEGPYAIKTIFGNKF